MYELDAKIMFLNSTDEELKSLSAFSMKSRLKLHFLSEY